MLVAGLRATSELVRSDKMIATVNMVLALMVAVEPQQLGGRGAYFCVFEITLLLVHSSWELCTQKLSPLAYNHNYRRSRCTRPGLSYSLSVPISRASTWCIMQQLIYSGATQTYLANVLLPCAWGQRKFPKNWSPIFCESCLVYKRRSRQFVLSPVHCHMRYTWPLRHYVPCNSWLQKWLPSLG